MTNTMLALSFIQISQTMALPPGLLSAVCYVESNHKITAINHKDGKHPAATTSYGICQIKKETAASVGFKGTAKKLQDPITNMYWAAKFLKFQLKRYGGDPRKAVAAYNAGAYRVNQKGLIKNRKYVGKVFTAWARYK